MGKDDKEVDTDAIANMGALGIVGLLIVAVIGIWHAFHSGSGVGLIASAISFGVIACLAFT